MNLLFLGYPDSPLITYLRKEGNTVLSAVDRITPEYIRENNVEFLISYGYKHIIKPEILALLPSKAINLHISYLPWNRGADPTLWSFLEDTPKGVTIHYIDDGIDTGDVIVQKIVELDLNASLYSCYIRLHYELTELFMEHWPEIKIGACKRHRQINDSGSYHRIKDKDVYMHLLTQEDNVPVAKLVGLANKNR